jgi:hypothetical protein
VEEGVKVKSLSKSHSLEVESWGGAMNIGSIQLGQSKDLVLEVTAPPSAANLLAASLSFEMVGTSGGKQRVSAKISAGQEEDTAKIAEILYHSARANFLDAMSTALEYQIQGDNDDAMKEIKAFIKKNNTTLKESSAFANGSNKEAAVKISDLVKDAAGQVAEAFSREEYFRKWGRHVSQNNDNDPPPKYQNQHLIPSPPSTLVHSEPQAGTRNAEMQQLQRPRHTVIRGVHLRESARLCRRSV